MLDYQTDLKQYARALRKNQTDVEQKLWSALRRKQLLGYQFYRQKPLGPYIVDMYCPAQQLVIELDGGQHYLDEGIVKDAVRDLYLKEQDLTVLRFSNREILEQFDGVLETILHHITR